MVNNMKKLLYLLAIPVLLTACYDDWDDANVKNFSEEELQAQDTFPAANISIKELKKKYCNSRDGATFSRNSSNWEFLITDSLYIEGVICANDGQFGTNYQSLYLRSIDPATGEDACIQIGVKNPCLYPLYPVGQRIRLDLRGLYVGTYSQSPKIGYPYFTSSGNHNLGPILLETFREHVQLIGLPDTSVPECQDNDYVHSNFPVFTRNIDYYPTIGTVKGIFTEADSAKQAILAPDDLEDAGYGVNRNFKLSSGTNMIVRTSTGNEVSNIVMPQGDTVQLSGVLLFDTYDSEWQIILRDTADFKILK